MLSLIVNEEFFQSLKQEDQQVVLKAAEIAKNYARKQADARVKERLAIITQSGTNIITLDEAMIKEIRKEAAVVYEDIHKQAGDAIYHAYTKHMQ